MYQYIILSSVILGLSYILYFHSPCQNAQYHLDRNEFDLAYPILIRSICPEQQARYIDLTYFDQRHDQTFKALWVKKVTVERMLKIDLNNYFWLLEQGFSKFLVDLALFQHFAWINGKDLLNYFEQYADTAILPLIKKDLGNMIVYRCRLRAGLDHMYCYNHLKRCFDCSSSVPKWICDPDDLP